MNERDGFIDGVPCWIDLAVPDAEAATAFYGEVLGWEFEDVMAPGAPGHYFYARKDGLLVGGIASAGPDEATPPTWATAVWVDDADATVGRVTDAGGTVAVAPQAVGDSGRFAGCVDPSGARFSLWEPGTNRGVQLVNADGAWNFSDLHTDDPVRAAAFYGAVFGWQVGEPHEMMGGTSWISLPGYGDFLAVRDPEIRQRQEAQGASGFVDVVASLAPLGAERVAAGTGPHWAVSFGIDDADGTAERAAARGGTVLAGPADLGVVRATTIRDPQGGVFVVQEYHPERMATSG